MKILLFAIGTRVRLRSAFPSRRPPLPSWGSFLGCGIPYLGNASVSDMAAVLEGERVGVALDAFDPASLKQGLNQLLKLAADPSTAARCVAAAQKHFSLDEGVQRYAVIYQQLGATA
jgi:hypothetical protein